MTTTSTSEIVWERDLTRAKERVARERKVLLIDVMKVPCRGCARLDAETYTDPRLIEAVTNRFVPLKLNLFEDPREVVRPLDVIWTPTILFADRRGTVHHRSLNFLPPDLFLILLDLGEAIVDLYWSRHDHAIAMLGNAYDGAPDSQFAPELLYWLGIAGYLKTHGDDDMYRPWNLLRQRFPDSIWSARVP
ncbi:MAG TPA: thioredoxin family protein [Thermomicrobiaceae bacterium]|nr:thioredoxin family protein [Thermomicrobiaceae bacterium]